MNFLQEKKELYNNLSKKIFNTELLSKTISQTKLLYTLKQFVQLKMSYDDINELFSNSNDIKTLLETKDNKQLLDILNNEYINGYYKNHITRNDIFAKNIINEIKKDTANIVVVSAEETDVAPTTTTTDTTDDVTITEEISSYSAYLSLYANSDKSTDNVVYDFDNAVLETEPLEFDVTVPKSGIYYIGMRYKSLDKQMSNFRIGLKVDGAYPFDKAEKNYMLSIEEKRVAGLL